MSAPLVTRISLKDFRSYATLDLPVSRRLVALTGENGAGKTNLLEALSLFTQGRGLRRADLGSMARHGNNRFAVSVAVEAGEGAHRLGVGLEPGEAGGSLRVCRIDGLDSAASSFSEHLRVVWLTPDLDSLFRDSPGERRRFLDRLVLAIDARHGARVSALERALRSRNRLLEEGAAHPAWLDAVERELAEVAVAVASARRETVDRLDAELLSGSGGPSPFPFARLALEGEFDTMLAIRPAIEAEDHYRRLLRDHRGRDAAAGRTLVGPQASDLAVRHGPKDLPAPTCSTGEQKALLVGLVLAHARLVATMSGIAPLLLLDEVSAHLDHRRRAGLYEALDKAGGQVWMTGADPGLFAELEGRADLFVVSPGAVRRP